MGIVFLSSQDPMLVHRRVTFTIKFASTHLYTWVERGTVRDFWVQKLVRVNQCLAQEHNVMSPASIQTRAH